MKDHAREKDTAAWLRQEYGDALPAFPVTADGAAGDVPWPKVQRRIAQLIKEDRFYTQEEQDRFDNIDPIAIREALAERGIVNGQVADPEKLDNDPIRQVMQDVIPRNAQAEPPATVREIYEKYLPLCGKRYWRISHTATPAAIRTGKHDRGREAVKRAGSSLLRILLFCGFTMTWPAFTTTP